MLRSFLRNSGSLRTSWAVGCLFGLLPVLTIACDDPANSAPVIDSVEAPLVVSEQNGTYAIPITVLFHDRDREAVTHVRYQLAPGVDGIVDVPAPNPTRESAAVTIVIPARAHHNGRARTLQLSLIDSRGAESLPQSSPVTLD